MSRKSKATYQINEGAGAHALLRGAARDLSGWTIRLSAEAKGESVVLSEVAGVAVGEGEVADYRLPIPPLPPSYSGYELVVVAEQEGKRDIVLMPSAAGSISLVVTDRGYAGDDEDALPAVPEVGTAVIRAAEDEKGTFHVDDASGEHAGPVLTYEIAAGEVGPPPRHQTRVFEGRGQIAWEQPDGTLGEWLSPGNGIKDFEQREDGTLVAILEDGTESSFSILPAAQAALAEAREIRSEATALLAGQIVALGETARGGVAFRPVAPATVTEETVTKSVGPYEFDAAVLTITEG